MNKPKTFFANGVNPFTHGIIQVPPQPLVRNVKGVTSREALFNQMRTGRDAVEVPATEYDAFRRQISRYVKNHELGETLRVCHRKDADNGVYRVWFERKYKKPV